MTKTEFLLTISRNIDKNSDENKENYQLEYYKFIQYQILQTSITRTVWQTVRRITNEILGVKESINVTIYLGDTDLKLVAYI